MKFLILLSLSLLFFLNSNGQDKNPLTMNNNEWRMWKKRQKYKMSIWKYSHEIHMKNGSILNSNSKIFFDSLSNKAYIYYSTDDSLRKIYPEETERISRVDPYKKERKIDGLPTDNRWKFQVVSGAVNGYSSFTNTTQPEEFSIGTITTCLPVTSEVLENMLKSYEDIYQIYLHKDYYQAITLYNKRNKKSLPIQP